MKRRSFLKKAGAGAAAALAATAVGAPAVHAGDRKIHWTAASAWGPNLQIFHDGIEMFCQKVKVMSRGQLEITIEPEARLKSASDIFQDVSQGRIQMGSGTPFYWSDNSAAFNWFGGIPFGMNAQMFNAWLYQGNGLKLMEELYGRYNLLPRVVGNTGIQMGGWFQKEIQTIEDFKEIKMRLPPLAGKVLSAFGVTAVPVPGALLPSALESGALDAAEFASPVHDFGLGLHKLAKFYYTPGWHEPGTPLDLFFYKKAYDSLPDHLKHIVDEVAASVNVRVLARFDGMNSDILNKMVRESGVALRIFPPPVLAQIKKRAFTVVENEANKDPLILKIHRDYRSFQSKTTVWGRMGEKLYWEML